MVMLIMVSDNSSLWRNPYIFWVSNMYIAVRVVTTMMGIYGNTKIRKSSKVVYIIYETHIRSTCTIHRAAIAHRCNDTVKAACVTMRCVTVQNMTYCVYPLSSTK